MFDVYDNVQATYHIEPFTKRVKNLLQTVLNLIFDMGWIMGVQFLKQPEEILKEW